MDLGHRISLVSLIFWELDRRSGPCQGKNALGEPLMTAFTISGEVIALRDSFLSHSHDTIVTRTFSLKELVHTMRIETL